MNPNADPNTFLADDYEPGDQFAFSIRPDDVYEILERTELPGELVGFTARPVPDLDNEKINYHFTFPAIMPISARRRIRTFQVPCMICKTPGRHKIDTAYYTMHAALCGKH